MMSTPLPRQPTSRQQQERQRQISPQRRLRQQRTTTSTTTTTTTTPPSASIIEHQRLSSTISEHHRASAHCCLRPNQTAHHQSQDPDQCPDRWCRGWVWREAEPAPTTTTAVTTMMKMVRMVGWQCDSHCATGRCHCHRHCHRQGHCPGHCHSHRTQSPVRHSTRGRARHPGATATVAVTVAGASVRRSVGT